MPAVWANIKQEAKLSLG